MTSRSALQPRTSDLAERLQARFVDDHGQHPAADEVDEVIRLAAQGLADARLQEFVPLLIEHGASDLLRSRGLHTVAPCPPSVGPALVDQRDRRRRSVRGQRGTAANRAGAAPVGQAVHMLS